MEGNGKTINLKQWQIANYIYSMSHNDATTNGKRKKIQYRAYGDYRLFLGLFISTMKIRTGGSFSRYRK
jgi:hypothetical protein